MRQHHFEIRLEIDERSDNTNDRLSDIFDVFSQSSHAPPQGLSLGGVQVVADGEDFGTGTINTSSSDALMVRISYVVDDSAIDMEGACTDDVQTYVRDFLEAAGMTMPEDFDFSLQRENHTRLFEGKKVDDPVVVEALKPIKVKDSALNPS